MVLDPILQSLPVHFFGSRPQPPTSPWMVHVTHTNTWHICTMMLYCIFIKPPHYTTQTIRGCASQIYTTFTSYITTFHGHLSRLVLTKPQTLNTKPKTARSCEEAYYTCYQKTCIFTHVSNIVLYCSEWWEVGGWGRDPKKCTGSIWGMGSSTI